MTGGGHGLALEAWDCAACHQDRYDETKDPDHVASNYPKECETCHSTGAWEPADFSGHDQYWPLTGAHAEASCASCHDGGVYAGTPRTCDGCHHEDYVATIDPDHEADGFPLTCDTCHSTFAWEPAEFSDHDQYWPLTGRHAEATCASCHEGGVYEGTPRQCVGCHEDDYQGTVNPGHGALNLGTDCDDCHTTLGWSPAEFPSHDPLFPLSWGEHARYRDDCRACHATPETDWSSFFCIGCHDGEHRRSEMDDEHLGEVGDYASEMASAPTPDAGCLSCHPRGTEEDD